MYHWVKAKLEWCCIIKRTNYIIWVINNYLFLDIYFHLLKTVTYVIVHLQDTLDMLNTYSWRDSCKIFLHLRIWSRKLLWYQQRSLQNIQTEARFLKLLLKVASRLIHLKLVGYSHTITNIILIYDFIDFIWKSSFLTFNVTNPYYRLMMSDISELWFAHRFWINIYPGLGSYAYSFCGEPLDCFLDVDLNLLLLFL